MSIERYPTEDFSRSSVRFLRLFCVTAIVSGVLLFAAGNVTIHQELTRADEMQVAGFLMPAEVAGVVLGPVLAGMGWAVLYQMPRPRR